MSRSVFLFCDAGADAGAGAVWGLCVATLFEMGVVAVMVRSQWAEGRRYRKQ